MSNVILETRGLTKEFSGFTAVNSVDLKVQTGHIHALIGPNGAGKTTFFNLLTKFHTPTKGQILYQGQEITALKSNQIARQGLVRNPEHRRPPDCPPRCGFLPGRTWHLRQSQR